MNSHVNNLVTLQDAKRAIQELHTEITKPDIELKLTNAANEANGNLDNILTLVIPMIYEIQGHVIENYGYPPDDNGFASFASDMNYWENQDEQLKADAQTFKQLLKVYTQVHAEEEEEEDATTDDEDERT
jgi:hypothetical protein